MVIPLEFLCADAHIGGRNHGRFEMYRELSRAGHVIALTVAKAIAAVADALRNATAIEEDRYHPEAHYMRGPGPKWREKHAQASASHDLRPMP